MDLEFEVPNRKLCISNTLATAVPTDMKAFVYRLFLSPTHLTGQGIFSRRRLGKSFGILKKDEKF
jgi:hypothetical protein